MLGEHWSLSLSLSLFSSSPNSLVRQAPCPSVQHDLPSLLAADGQQEAPGERVALLAANATVIATLTRARMAPLGQYAYAHLSLVSLDSHGAGGLCRRVGVYLGSIHVRASRCAVCRRARKRASSRSDLFFLPRQTRSPAKSTHGVARCGHQTRSSPTISNACPSVNLQSRPPMGAGSGVWVCVRASCMRREAAGCFSLLRGSFFWPPHHHANSGCREACPVFLASSC